MEKVDYMAVAEEAIAGIKKGAFLTVRAGDALNTMAIGWATVGFVWGKPIVMVAVRDSRHTFGIIERAVDFTVTVPLADMHEAVMFCGTRSGRGVDKFEACRLEVAEAQYTTSPIVDTPGLHFECKIMFKDAMDPACLARELDSLYPDKDYHTLYFGEVLDCYRIG